VSVDEYPQWIDDVDPSVMCDGDHEPDPGDEVAVREWVNRQLRRVAVLRRERAVQQQIADNEHARIDQWHRETVGQLDRAIAHHAAPVEAWMQQRLTEDGKTRSYMLPAGRVQARKLPDLVEIDPEVVPEFLVSYPQFARMKLELDKHALNDAVKRGLEFDGVAVTAGRVNITIVTDDT
jgi:phage host-nuclease inhibitor protein Gam